MKMHAYKYSKQRDALIGATRWRVFLATLIPVVGAMLTVSSVPAGASSSPADQGVTSKTINLGNPYVNFDALKSLGININEGSFPDAYNAAAAYINAHGGVNGRKIVMQFVEMNPAVPAEQTSSCTQLTEDDKIFAVMSPVFPACYQQQHDTPVIYGSEPAAVPASAAPDFSLATSTVPFDALELQTFAKMGVFKNKKVGIFYAADSDKAEVAAVQTDLKKLHANVALTGEDSVQATDAVASDQDVASIAERFKSAGVNEVIAVGGAGVTTWPRALLDNESTYKPPWIASTEGGLGAYIGSLKGNDQYLDNMLTASPVESYYQQWQDPAMQKCIAEVKKAYPSDTIDEPANPARPATATSASDQTAVSVEQACQDLALFVKIAAAAGKNLTVASFTKAGYGLKNVSIPGSPAVSFAPNQPYAVGPVSVDKYSPTSENLVPVPTTGK